MAVKKTSLIALTVDNFINNPRVLKCITDLKTAFPEKSNPLIISDVLDGNNLQYVNLVQKGGGVLGVALVGYTYILEEMGIRFIRLAGTSAGAINTALMTVIGTKEEAKSTRMLDAICKLDFFSFVDGHPAAHWIIKKFISNKNFMYNLKQWLLGIALIFSFLIIGDIIFLAYKDTMPWMSILVIIFLIITAIFLALLGTLIYYISSLIKQLKNAGIGINPGNVFYDWIKKQLSENNVHTVTDLNNKAAAPIQGLHLRVPNPEELNGLKGDVTFITSELVTENKIQFPEMWSLFRININDLQPAGFIRASMSIPVFFESYFINDIPCNDEKIKKEWMDRFGESDPPSTARFVDGGILSNLPINIFYNPKVIVPRLPSFGIDLDDTLPDNKSKHAEGWSLLGYCGRIFNTIRYYYDKDFLLKNKVFKKGIGTVELSEYNWLNFFLTPEDKINMFIKGAEAAKEFLINFNWEEYKNNRIEMREQLLKDEPKKM